MLYQWGYYTIKPFVFQRHLALEKIAEGERAVLVTGAACRMRLGWLLEVNYFAVFF